VGLTLYLTGLAPLRRLLRRAAALLPALHMQPPPPERAAPPPPPGAPHGHVPAGPPGGAAGGLAAAPPGAAGGHRAAHAVAAGAAAPAAGAAAGPTAGAAGPQPQAPPARGLARELQALVVGFFTSLLPGAACARPPRSAPPPGRSSTCMVAMASQKLFRERLGLWISGAATAGLAGVKPGSCGGPCRALRSLTCGSGR